MEKIKSYNYQPNSHKILLNLIYIWVSISLEACLSNTKEYLYKKLCGFVLFQQTKLLGIFCLFREERERASGYRKRGPKPKRLLLQVIFQIY